MTLEQTTKGRRIAAKTGTWIFLVFFLAVLDAIISQARQPLNHFDLLPGGSEPFNFPLRETVKTVEELSCISDSDAIHVTFDSIHKGFFLGGEMVRGAITVDKGGSPGRYQLKMGLKERLPQKMVAAFSINVYANPESRRQHDKSFFRKTFDMSPGKVALGFLCLLVATLGMVYYFSSIRESLLMKSGKADIYRIKRNTDFLEITFGLGSDHGLLPGMQIQVLDRAHQVIGAAEINTVFQADSIAKIPLTQKVFPGYMVSIMP